MRRWETLTALAGVISAIAGATHFPEHEFFTYLAIALIALVSISRLQFALAARRSTPSDAAERARRIREGRGR